MTRSLDVVVLELAGPEASAACAVALAQVSSPPPSVRIASKADGSIPRRRLLALQRSTADLVLLVEDTVRLDPRWLTTCHEAAASPSFAGGSGAVRLAPSLDPRACAWARHEYAGAIGAPPGTVETLPGHLLLLDRAQCLDALENVEIKSDGVREDELFPALRVTGAELHIVEGLGAEIVAADPTGSSLRGQFLHGRGWAARESLRRGWSTRRRLGRLAAWPAVAALRLGRAAPPLTHPAELRHALALSAAWALGEGVGAVLGRSADEGHWT